MDTLTTNLLNNIDNINNIDYVNGINNKFCHSVQSKTNLLEQCCNKPKQNEVLCGKHLNSKKVILFSPNVKNNNIVNQVINNIDSTNIGTIFQKSEQIIVVKESIKIYTKEELFEKIANNENMSVSTIRSSIKKCGLKNVINTKESKPFLIIALKAIIEKERFYITNERFIISIQTIFRKWLVYRRTLCVNDNDILTFNSKYEIPEEYFYIFYDSVTNKKYAYDIRTLDQIINSDYQTCPYTFRSFTDEDKDKINLYKNKLIKHGIDISIPKKILTFEEETDMKIKDVFHQINMLDNYTNHVWFKDLNIYQLIELYVRMEDIWNYRSNMSSVAKKRIVTNGIIFNIPHQIIKVQKSKIKLQNVLLNEFLRMISEGVDREERKLGAILILTGLVEVSGNAANALPHLIQI